MGKESVRFAGHRVYAQRPDVAKVPHMNNEQHALATEIRSEAAAQRITAKQLQQAAGISASAWANYFTRCTRDVPMSVVVAVAEALGMTASELLRRAEARVATVDPVAHELEAGLSPGGRRALEQARRELGVGESVADPFGNERADHDDGIGRSAIRLGRTG